MDSQPCWTYRESNETYSASGYVVAYYGGQKFSLSGGLARLHPRNKSPSAIAVTIVAAIAAAIAVPRAAAIAGVRAYESVPLYAVPL